MDLRCLSMCAEPEHVPVTKEGAHVLNPKRVDIDFRVSTAPLVVDILTAAECYVIIRCGVWSGHGALRTARWTCLKS